MIVRDRDIPVTARTVSGVIAEFLRDVRPRLLRLGRAYEGRGAIVERMRAPGLPNNRLVHAFPRYIVTMASGYLVGKPVSYEYEDADAAATLKRLYTQSDMDSVDAELAVDAAIYGRGVCVLYADEQGRPRAATLSPKAAFVVYDDTVEHRPLFGVHWLDRFDAQGRRCGVTVYVATQGEMIAYEGKGLSSLGGVAVSRRRHFFGGVPMVEFWNNAQETGDFEPVLSLIEAYDMLESDRVNDKQQFTDAVLLLTGCTLQNDDPADKRTPAQKLIEEKTLCLPDTDAKAEWLCKQVDEAGVQVLADALRSDIHKMSMVPDLTDEHFASNVSGVAMRYKLLGLEQLTSIKERWFREGLRSRLRLFAHFMRVLAAPPLDPEKVVIRFTRSLPVNESEMAQMVAQLDGIVPREALLSQLPFIEDVQQAAKDIAAQQETAD